MRRKKLRLEQMVRSKVKHPLSHNLRKCVMQMWRSEGRLAGKSNREFLISPRDVLSIFIVPSQSTQVGLEKKLGGFNCSPRQYTQQSKRGQHELGNKKTNS